MNFQERIEAARRKLGENLVIFGHHYQNDSVIRHVDRSGDSLELARMASQTQAEHIVFCGVHFMGESAALLASPTQKVYLPEPAADCVMARMAPAWLLDAVMNILVSRGRKVIPLTYVNSSMAVKAVCGKYGGSVCTSSNAETMLSWARAQGDAVLFVPDSKLGRNMAKRVGIAAEEQLVINISKNGKILEDLQNQGKLDSARLFLWPGCCAIHACFNLKQIEKFRRELPDAKIIVHPECSPDVVEASDFSSSTSAIIKYVEAAPAGSKLIIGTEIRLVNRLRSQYAGEKEILPLLASECSGMSKVTEEKLAQLLDNIIAGNAEPVLLDEGLANYASKALQTMLDVCKLQS